MENSVGVRAQRALDQCGIRKVAAHDVHASVAEISCRHDVGEHDLANRTRTAARIGQRAARENGSGEACSKETGAAGDHDAHRLSL